MQIHRFFDEKVVIVRASTADAPLATFSTVPLGCALRNFRPMTVVDVIPAVRLFPDKQCTSDPLPTRVLKENIDELEPFVVKLFNCSLPQSIVPTAFKAAFLIRPTLNRTDHLEPVGVVETARKAGHPTAAYRLP